MACKRTWAVAAALVLAAGGAASDALDFGRLEPGEAEPGGGATSRAPRNANAFSHPSANMHFQRQIDFKVGDGIFRKFWVSAPASTKSSDGLGPLFNSRSCQGCHLKDGRGHPPAPGDAAVSMFLRLSIPPQSDEDRLALSSSRASVIAEPTYGTQLQNFSIQGVLAEGRMEITYEERPVTLSGGEVVRLRKPAYRAVELNYGPLHPQAMLSPRVAPPMIGMGLLESIPEADILALADPDDSDGNGISGRPNQVWSPSDGKPRLGRFGWKAGEASIAAQSAHAFAGDMGLSSAIAPDAWGDCSVVQKDCRAAPDGRDAKEGVEVTKQMLDLVVFYARNLAVPARPNAAAADVLAGKRAFHAAGCAACHQPSFTTGSDAVGPEQSAQKIWPYTDLLLHDMGGGLADDRPEGVADGREWRTPPLWGIGLTEAVSGHTQLLHDGRARNLLEAILWHGGEAEAARQRVIAMPKQEREALLAFLRSL